jgi:hypothetical protein
MSYPTSPPWAPPPAPPAEQAAPEAPYTMHGQLLVAYPEEMDTSGRLKPPAWWPVAVFTFFFWPAGVISAVRRGGRARRSRHSRSPYWIAFAAAVVAAWIFWFAVGAVVATPVYNRISESLITDSLQKNLVGDGQLEKRKQPAKAASCRPTDLRGSDGLRDYSCVLRLTSGETGTISVTADTDGNWKPVKD